MNRFASGCGPFLVDLVVNPNPSDIGCFASSSKKSWSLVLRYCGFALQSHVCSVELFEANSQLLL